MTSPSDRHGDSVGFTRDGHIAIVTINRPERRNALDPPSTEIMSNIWDQVRDDDDIWVAILTGTGAKAFSAGADLKWSQENPGQSLESVVGPNGFGGLVNRWDLYKPLIAAVRGYCLGGGFELALACDIVITDPTATFGLPEPRVGHVACWGGVQRLATMLPRSAVNRLLLAGEFLSARQANELGLVYEVVESVDVLDRAVEFANQLCDAAPLALQATKALYLQTVEHGLREAITGASQHPAMKRLQGSVDQEEGRRAFKERRKPRWTGR